MATSRELLNAQLRGAEILHNGAPVSYSPRKPGDRQPWLNVTQVPDSRAAKGWRFDPQRYTADQCQIFWPQEVSGGTVG